MAAWVIPLVTSLASAAMSGMSERKAKKAQGQAAREVYNQKLAAQGDYENKMRQLQSEYETAAIVPDDIKKQVLDAQLAPLKEALYSTKAGIEEEAAAKGLQAGTYARTGKAGAEKAYLGEVGKIATEQALEDRRAKAAAKLSKMNLEEKLAQQRMGLIGEQPVEEQADYSDLMGQVAGAGIAAAGDIYSGEQEMKNWKEKMKAYKEAGITPQIS